ncbi:MAG: TonB-dependent receptor [Mangrovibacterium sp.]
MRLTLFAILVSVVQIFATNAHAQQTLLSLNFKNASIRSVLGQIENQSDFYFIYNAKAVDVEKKVSIEVENKSIPEILDRIFEGSNVTYKIDKRQIAISTNLPENVVQQEITVSGRVTDSSGLALPGVTVVLKGTTQGTITDASGNYSLANVSTDATLVFSFVGMKSQEILVSRKTSINIIMAEETLGIEEVVAIGYGTQRKDELTSSVAHIKSDDFVMGPSSSVDAASLIRGKVAGLTVVQADGNPLSTSQIMLRGVMTLKSSSAPLVIIDGVEGKINDVSPNDIEQIDVLKDGSAAAIYGTRGTNGVVIISTKKAQGEMPVTIDVNSYISTQIISKQLDILTADEYAELAKQGATGALDFGSRTDWMKEITQTPFNKTFSISLKGSTHKTSYIASLDYTDNEGIVKKSLVNVLYPRLNVVHRMWDNLLKIETQIGGYQRSYGFPYSSWYENPYFNALQYNPTYSIKNEDGTWNENGSSPTRLNPVALIEESKGDNRDTNIKMYSKATLNPIEGLNINWLVSRETDNFFGSSYETQRHKSTTMYNLNGNATQTSSRTQNDMMEVTAQYTNKFDAHSIDGLVGYSWNDYNYRYSSMNNYDFPSDDYTYNNMGMGTALSEGKASMSSSQNSSRLVGWFARLNYNYANKYFLSASVRHEGSSKFGANHKWGNFPAVSAGWNIAKENFMKDVDYINNLKLRAGYGITGTAPSDSYMSLTRLNLGGYAYYKGQWITQLKASGNPNPDLRWEKKKEFNFGLDYGLFNDRISGSIDYYIRNTEDLIWDYQVSVPPYYSTSITANAGSIRNSGLEVSISAIPVQTKDFIWNTNLNFSTNKSELISLSNDKYVTGNYIDGSVLGAVTHRLEVGKPLGNFFGWKAVGIDENGKWLIEGADGSVKSFDDAQGSDRQVIGNALPKFYLNFNNSLKYKWFDMSLTMRGAFGFQVNNYVERTLGVPSALGVGNVLASAFEPKMDNRPLASDASNGNLSYYIEDADFWKIDNVTLGYTPDIAQLKWIKKLRIYASVSNLATFTGYTGLDPEVSISGRTPGVDHIYQYPTTRTYTVGINLTF